MIKQINNVYEKDLNERLRKIGITSSQCAVLDYLFHTSRDEISQRDVEKALNLKNPTVTGILKRLDEKGYILCVPNAKDKRKKNIYRKQRFSVVPKRYKPPIGDHIGRRLEVFFICKMGYFRASSRQTPTTRLRPTPQRMTAAR